MAVQKETKVTAVARPLTSIGGTLEERVKAFQQISAAAASGLFPAGYDTVQKITAACWFADGLGIHPTIYMEGVQPVQFGGKTQREPKWEFVNALLRSNLPGFDYKVYEETDEACEIEFFAAGRNSQRVRYTMAEAVKQGLAGPGGRNTDTYAKSGRKMLWKQCFKMGADRIGADALAGLPTMAQEYEPEQTKPNGSAADAIAATIEAAEATAKGEVPVEVPVVYEIQPEPAPAKPASARQRLYELLEKQYGKLSKEVAAERASFLYNTMIQEQTGTNPKIVFTKAAPIGPIEAEQVIAYLTPRMEAKGRLEPTEEDEAPPVEASPEPEAPEPASSSKDSAYDALMGAVGRARKLFGRKFVVESPPQSGKYWFTDQNTLMEAGLAQSTLIQNGAEVVAAEPLLVTLAKILTAACDNKERAGR